MILLEMLSLAISRYGSVVYAAVATGNASERSHFHPSTFFS